MILAAQVAAVCFVASLLALNDPSQVVQGKITFQFQGAELSPSSWSSCQIFSPNKFMAPFDENTLWRFPFIASDVPQHFELSTVKNVQALENHIMWGFP